MMFKTLLTWYEVNKYPPLIFHNDEVRVMHPSRHLATERCWRCTLTRRPTGLPGERNPA